MKKFSTQLALALGTIILLTPVAAFAQNPHAGGSGTHMRPVLFHDRSPRPHVHTVSAHH
jgi:hypothetical protein